MGTGYCRFLAGFCRIHRYSPSIRGRPATQVRTPSPLTTIFIFSPGQRTCLDKSLHVTSGHQFMGVPYFWELIGMRFSVWEMGAILPWMHDARPDPESRDPESRERDLTLFGGAVLRRRVVRKMPLTNRAFSCHHCLPAGRAKTIAGAAGWHIRDLNDPRMGFGICERDLDHLAWPFPCWGQRSCFLAH